MKHEHECFTFTIEHIYKYFRTFVIFPFKTPVMLTEWSFLIKTGSYSYMIIKSQSSPVRCFPLFSQPPGRTGPSHDHFQDLNLL